MARWEPGAQERLQQAALDLFLEQGFEQTTATEIAHAVGLTERTFFRYFSDKREVLFRGRGDFLGGFLTGLAAPPADAPPMAVVAAAVRSGSAFFADERRPYSRRRQAVIDANPPLGERERHKLSELADVIADGLRSRGADDLHATLAAESGITAFRAAFAQWLREDETRSLVDIVTDVFAELSAVTAAVTLRAAAD